MIGDLYGDYYRLQKDWKRVKTIDWIMVILSDILGGVGIGLLLAPFIMLVLRTWTIEFAVSVATINALLGLVLVGIGKLIFDRTGERLTLTFVYYLGTLISLIFFLFVSVGFYTRFTYIIAA